MQQQNLTSQLNKEAKWAFWLSLFYLVGWVFFAYFSSSKRGIFGFPLWFELSCIFLPLVFTGIVYLAIKKVYCDIDLNGAKDE
ncbi:hypothetical protein A6046_02095 [[Haemophilus] ducreyi]|uniref:Inner membrane protein n=2 Tax=Haemophilus ducreyi TaxID=730 RepID=Q7VN91_HAEDU|nr:DUF997 family protein [[Haemophilus] ducreyi]AAP95595.1 hypothetical protein HD_0673 [[Haemophilus] ducreyi 35000HP]AKO30671.1 membrane protein [[Haemophilus] ducreyi]AKO32108.1 membrane protein [[Haemophilus] ducreyi]AKO33564.1 membrane protein [[Haemophilus] ducreyi]AKO35009.1 membrane protein [[Haemophilus] ducreyi]